MKRSMIVGAGFIIALAVIYVMEIIQNQPEKPDPFAR